jgi:glycosyltransferase involved in cell wall biosynthesis
VWQASALDTYLNPASHAPVSVVIPAFHAVETLVHAVDSVASQTVCPCELIVVDDGSRDGTAGLARRLATQYPAGWMKVVELMVNSGAASARNAGWALATGDWVAFLDADDTWHPRKIECQYGYLKEHPETALCGHAFMFSDAPRPVPDVPAVAREVARWRLLLGNPFVTPSVMLQRRLKQRFASGKRHMEDHLLWLEIAFSGGRVVRLDQPLALLGKPQFGASGLSAQLWSMELGELDNYARLGATHQISPLLARMLQFYSLLKFARRLIIVAFRRGRPAGGLPT